jgi:hypothetical protein
MSKKTLKKILGRVAKIDKSLAVVALAVANRKNWMGIPKPDSNTEHVLRCAAERRLAYVRAIGSCRDLNELRVATSEVARQRGEFPSPSITTILRWQRFINSDGSLPLLLCSRVRQSRKNRLYED